MNQPTIRGWVRGDRGLAMTETALLCFFLYMPLLMMVIIWGDMTLDKLRAHIASAYVVFSGRAPDADEVRAAFFPGADGLADGLGAVREADIESVRVTAGPRYELPVSRDGDYSGDPPDHDLQYSLYSMAQGRVWITTHLDTTDGELGFVYRLHRSRNEMAAFLDRSGIVDMQTPGELPPVRPGEEVDIDTGADSRAYTAYVEVLTQMFNDMLSDGGQMPRGEVSVVLRTRLRSPFFRELERSYDRPRWGGAVIGAGLPDAFEMRFGTVDELPEGSPWQADSSFHTGYAYLRNPGAHPDGETLMERLSALGQDAVLAETSTMFRRSVNGVEVHPGAMWSLEAVSAREGHETFLTPGDPPREWD